VASSSAPIGAEDQGAVYFFFFRFAVLFGAFFAAAFVFLFFAIAALLA
jgi:hypothetical protein